MFTCSDLVVVITQPGIGGEYVSQSPARGVVQLHTYDIDRQPLYINYYLHISFLSGTVLYMHRHVTRPKWWDNNNNGWAAAA